MSWFNTSSLNATFHSLTESVAKATESVQNAIPEEYKEGLAKLTLNTEEMIHERQQFREEALRKEAAAMTLSQMLPWETKDAEREILVEECRDAILELSKQEETFFGPYEMPLLNVQLDDDDEDVGVDNQTGQVVDMAESTEKEDLGVNDSKDETLVADAAAAVVSEDVHDTTEPAAKNRHQKPSEESKEKLSKLQPLPPLLEDFDLDAHVGLIQKVLKEDPVLVKMQANLSGGGARERIFWKNYFFHCAYTRYEAGLSIDEIWSYHVQSVEESVGTPDVAGENKVEGTSEREEETVVFDTNADTLTPMGSSEIPHAGFQDVEKVMAADKIDIGGEGGAGTTDASLGQSDGSPNNGFELLDDSDDGGAVDPELDELEAEILRELEN